MASTAALLISIGRAVWRPVSACSTGVIRIPNELALAMWAEKNGGPAAGGDDRHRLGIRTGRGGADPKEVHTFTINKQSTSNTPGKEYTYPQFAIIQAGGTHASEYEKMAFFLSARCGTCQHPSIRVTHDRSCANGLRWFGGGSPDRDERRFFVPKRGASTVSDTVTGRADYGQI